MKKADRSKAKASRAARAQELLNSSSQNVAKPAAFGFGGCAPYLYQIDVIFLKYYVQVNSWRAQVLFPELNI